MSAENAQNTLYVKAEDAARISHAEFDLSYKNGLPMFFVLKDRNGRIYKEELDKGYEESVNKELKAKCSVSNEKVEEGTVISTHDHNSNMTTDRKFPESRPDLHDSSHPAVNHQEATNQELPVMYGQTNFPAVTHQESPMINGRTSFPPAEVPNGRWDNMKQYERKEVPFQPPPFNVMHNVQPSYQGEPVMNYSQTANMPNNQMFKAYTPLQYDFPPNSNGGAFMKVYYWHSNVPGYRAPASPPVPIFRNVDIYAQPSIADDFSDLPLDNRETLRFFYNLGVEYFRLGSFIFPTAVQPVPAVENLNTPDQGNKPEKHWKKRDYCRKSNLSQKNYRTL